jgi:hypothetical protein
MKPMKAFVTMAVIGAGLATAGLVLTGNEAGGAMSIQVRQRRARVVRRRESCEERSECVSGGFDAEEGDGGVCGERDEW